MKAHAALLRQPGEFSVEDVEVRAPTANEVLIRAVASGLCGSDLHLKEGRTRATYPIIGGHEGAGVVEAVGSDVQGLAPGDHVVCSPIPQCGRCPHCTRGNPNLCDMVAYAGVGVWPGAEHPAHIGGVGVAAYCMLGTFSELMLVNQASVIRIDDDIPLDRAALVGCGVMTGWCSAVYAADVQIGDATVVVGTGGVGMSAVQGAAHAGAEIVVAVDPVESKRAAALRLGATHAVATVEEVEPLLRDLTGGRMAQAVILTAGRISGEMLAASMPLAAKMGRIVITGGSAPGDVDVKLNLGNIQATQKQIVGTLLGNARPRLDIPLLLRLYRSGRLKLDEMISTTYSLDQVNAGYADLEAGRNIRGVIVHS